MRMVNGKPHLAALAAVAILASSVAAAGCGGGDDDEEANDGPTTPASTSSPGEGDNQTTFDLKMHEEGGNVFELGTEKNPTLTVPVGEEITINLTNEGVAIHNMRFAGDDNEFDNDDDTVSDPALVTAGQDGVLVFTAPGDAGTYDYRCDYHPTDMKGKIEVE